MIYLGLLSIALGIWIAYEIWRAPLVDQNDNIIKPTKRLRDFFRGKY